jgi:hypothetical protein
VRRGVERALEELIGATRSFEQHSMIVEFAAA